MKRALWRTWLVTAIFVSWAVPAGADSTHRVVLLTTESEQDLTALELLARVRGELHAAGLEVIAQPLPAETDLRVAVEVSSPELAPAAVIAVRYLRPAPPELAGAEVWISDRLSNSTLMQVVRASPAQADPALRLAVQIAEVLKARLSLLWVKPVEPEPPPPPTPSPSSPSAPLRAEPERNARLLLGLGLEWTRHAKGDVSFWSPVLRADYDLPASSWSTLSLGLSAAWTPEGTTLEREAGKAHLRQTLLLARASVRFFPHALLQPLVSAALGSFLVRVRGEAATPYTASTTSTWSAATTVGAGLWLQPGAGVAWLLEAQALAPWSATDVHIAEEQVATLGFPAFQLGTSVIGRY
ncbi:MAG TPA: hypothetical protein VER12_04655 [Polyangiaceae bacterium]|nr:hypothetical protein [Polyangiaceae bacterium]HYQ31005.1 hypothetical protein [Polyangiaceae bacterium]